MTPPLIDVLRDALQHAVARLTPAQVAEIEAMAGVAPPTSGPEPLLHAWQVRPEVFARRPGEIDETLGRRRVLRGSQRGSPRNELFTRPTSDLAQYRVVLPAPLLLDLAAGLRLGPYEVVRPLDTAVSGLMPVLVRNHHGLGRGRDVVLQFPMRQGDRRWQEALMTHADRWQALRDPHVLRLMGLRHVDKRTFLETEYVQGQNLAVVLKTVVDATARGHGHLRLLGRILLQVAEGLAFLEREGLAGTSLRPSKILVSEDLRQVRLADPVGLSRLLATPPASWGAPRAVPLRETLAELATTLSAVFASERDLPEWIQEIHRRTASGSEAPFADAGELLEHVRTFVEPEKGRRIAVTALRGKDQLQYDLWSEGAGVPRVLEAQVPDAVIADAFSEWDNLGRLALNRLDASDDGARAAFDDDITRVLEKVSRTGAQWILGREVRERLEREPGGATLSISYDPRLGIVPWEVLDVGEPLCLRFPMARRPRLKAIRSAPAWSRSDKLSFLFIPDPTGAAQDGHEECARLREVIESSRVEFAVAEHGLEAIQLMSMMEKRHVIHFAGHGLFSRDAARNRWVLGRMQLTAAMVRESLWTQGSPPVLVFANTCHGGRGAPRALNRDVETDAALGLAQAFLAAGVCNYVGSAWALPGDERTIAFAESFYRELFSREATVSQAVLTARKESRKTFTEKDLTWAAYMLFGDPFTRMPLPTTAGLMVASPPITEADEWGQGGNQP